MSAQDIEILSAARGFDADESHAKDVMRSKSHAVNFIIHIFTFSVSFIPWASLLRYGKEKALRSRRLKKGLHYQTTLNNHILPELAERNNLN
jgi:hypothetical protein